MSCVPSMSAYVATHSCQHDDKLPPPITQPSIDQSTKEKKSFWEWSGLKLIFLGHDGVGVLSTDMKAQKVDDKQEPLDLWSRVRHLSGSSTGSKEGEEVHLSSPESPGIDR